MSVGVCGIVRRPMYLRIKEIRVSRQKLASAKMWFPYMKGGTGPWFCKQDEVVTMAPMYRWISVTRCSDSIYGQTFDSNIAAR